MTPIKLGQATSSAMLFSSSSPFCFKSLFPLSSSRAVRRLSTNPPQLEDALKRKAEASRIHLAEVKQKYGNAVIDHVTVKATLGGMRGLRLLTCETSQVDPVAGIAYRGIPLGKLTEALPKVQGGSQPPMEALLWFLLTSEIPTTDECEMLRAVLVSRMGLSTHVVSAINALPTTTHPMTQFVVGISACQTESRFSADYKAGIANKEDYWRLTLHDGLTLLAKLPQITAQIYRRSFRPKEQGAVPSIDSSLDWAGNVGNLMGLDHPEMKDVLRLYVLLHADHEGGNVSAHAARLVGSALSDPFLAFTAAMCGLAGPLHGLANQETLRFLRRMALYLRDNKQSVNESSVRDYVEKQVLGKGKVVPGFGHAVLRQIDPRYTIQHQFAQKAIQGDELTNLLKVCAEVVPKILMATGKVANPFPNVDAHSGVVLSYFGLTEEDFYTVLFGLSRAVGVVSQLVWDRIFNLPIERPKSVDLKTLEKLASDHEYNVH